MSNLERFRSRRNLHNPVHPLSQIHSEINRTFERFFENPIWNESMPKMPAINMKEEGNQYVIEAEMPGLRDEDVEIEVHGGQLTIKGERKQESKKKESTCILKRGVMVRFTGPSPFRRMPTWIISQPIMKTGFS